MDKPIICPNNFFSSVRRRAQKRDSSRVKGIHTTFAVSESELRPGRQHTTYKQSGTFQVG